VANICKHAFTLWHGLGIEPRTFRSHVGQSNHYSTTPSKKYGTLQCYRRQSVLMEQWKIRPSVTLYPSTDYHQTWQDLLGLGPLPTSQVSLNFVGWRIPPKWMKYDNYVTFIPSLFFAFFPSGKTRRWTSTTKGSKHAESADGVCAFWRSRPKIFALRKPFFCSRDAQTLPQVPPNLVVESESDYVNFKFRSKI